MNGDSAKVLYFQYHDKSGVKLIRIYTEPYFDQAEADRDMLCEFGSQDKEYILQNVAFFNPMPEMTEEIKFCNCEMPAKMHGSDKCWRCSKTIQTPTP